MYVTKGISQPHTCEAGLLAQLIFSALLAVNGQEFTFSLEQFSCLCPVASPSAAAFRIKETYNWAVPGPGGLLSMAYKTLKSVAMNERMYAFFAKPQIGDG